MVAIRQPKRVRSQLAALLLASVSLAIPVGQALAGPWAQANRVQLRHDLQILADARVLQSPMISWPVPWGDIVSQLPPTRDDAMYPPHVLSSLRRVRAEARQNAREHGMEVQGHITTQSEQRRLRAYGETLREDNEIGIGFQATGRDWAVGINIQASDTRYNERRVRAAGSWLAWGLGNWMLSIDTLDRWWGPGWQGTLGLSSSARSVPSFSVQRNRSLPFKTRLLSWMGPWNFTARMGYLEKERDVPSALLYSARASIRPHPQLEFGWTHLAVWGGEGKQNGLSAFGDILFDRGDNEGDEDDEAANQLAGYDMRFNSAGTRVPFAFYAQAIGEDSDGGLPSNFVGLFGLETWGGIGSSGSSYRVVAEFADTRGRFYRGTPEYDTAYNHGTYSTGFRYRGLPIGHTADGDARVAYLGFNLSDTKDRFWQLSLRGGRLNDGPISNAPNSQTAVREHFGSFAFDASLPWRRSSGNHRYLSFGLEYVRSELRPNGSIDVEANDDFIGRLRLDF